MSEELVPTPGPQQHGLFKFFFFTKKSKCRVPGFRNRFPNLMNMHYARMFNKVHSLKFIKILYVVSTLRTFVKRKSFKTLENILE